MQREKRANIRGMLGMFKGMWRKPFSLDKINPMAREGGGDTWRCTGIRFGWLIENLIRENRIADISASKTEEVSIDLSLLEKE